MIIHSKPYVSVFRSTSPPAERPAALISASMSLSTRVKSPDESGLKVTAAYAVRRQPELGLERHRGGREREQPVVARTLELLAPEEDVAQAQAQATGRPISRAISASAARRFSIGG